MNPEKGYYSIIQYCPDLGRFEAANVGVLLFCPQSGFLQAKVSKNNSRIIQFFGRDGHDWKRLGAFKNAINDRLQKEKKSLRTLEDLNLFIAKRANQIQITNPLPMKVFNPETDLERLFKTLIGEQSRHIEKNNFHKLLAKDFSIPELEKKIIRNVQIQVDVFNKTIEIPYGYQNGRFNLINPVRFGSPKPEAVINTACRYAVEGRNIYEHRHSIHGDMQLIIVGQFPKNNNETESAARRVFDENSVTLIRYEEVPNLIDEIKSHGKELGSNLMVSN